MEPSGMFSIFHFLFCELIEECYTQYKEGYYLDNLKRIGRETGFKMYNQICIKKGILERPQNMTVFMKNIQYKVFKHLFGYEANSFYTAEDEVDGQTVYYYVLVDDISVYLTWMPESLWQTSVFVAGIIQSIANCSGISCAVTCQSKNKKGDKIQTQYFIKLSEKQYQKWKEE